MPAKKNVDFKKLIKMVESGTHQKEIMKAFGFKTAAQLKNYYLSALMDVGQAPKLRSDRSSKAAAPPKETFVNKRGSLIIPKAIVAEMEFSEGDKFLVRKTKSGISLKKL